MMKSIQLLATIIACHLAMQLSAQCRISVESPDSLAFVLSLNDRPVNHMPVLALTLDQPLSGKVNFKAEFIHRPELSFTQVITIKKGTAITYAIERMKGTLKFVLKSESEWLLPAGEMSASIPRDSSTIDARHAGCYPVVDDALYRDMLARAEQQHFESKKLAIMSAFASANCLRVEQLQFMLRMLSEEDNKLALLMASKGHVYDAQSMRTLLEEFFLARTKAKAGEIIEANR